MTLLEGLRAVRELLAVPERWTKGAYSRDRRGRVVGVLSWYSDDCVSWCLLGAVRHVADASGVGHIAMRSALENTVGEELTAFNDNGATHYGKLMGAIDQTIERVEAQHA